MQHLEGSSTPVLYTGRTVLKVKLRYNPLRLRPSQLITRCNLLGRGKVKAEDGGKARIPLPRVYIYIHIYFFFFCAAPQRGS
jgi:hypothetical protein